MRQVIIKFFQRHSKLLGAILVLYITTFTHHLYGGIVYDSPQRFYGAFASLGILALTLYLLQASQARRWAKRTLWLLLSVYWIFLIGIFEGGYNHVLKVALWLGGVGDDALHAFYPPGGDYVLPDDIFFEVTGILTFVFGLWLVRVLLREHSSGQRKLRRGA